MSSPSRTPADLHIEKRDLKFGREDPPARWWHSGDPGRTAFFNALSSTFPVGERFFMTAVRYYRDDTAQPLRGQIDDFLYQESMHTREHVVFNRQAQDAGYDIAPLEDRARRTIGWVKRRSPLQQLAATCALEHYTATLAHDALANPEHLGGAAPEARRMWQWHAIEEVEHKAVAFDTFLHATRHMTPMRRWLKRSLVMCVTTVRFHYVIFRNTADLLRQDGLNDFATWRSLLRYLYGRPGTMRMLLRGAFTYMRPGFHPWEIDDRALIVTSLAQLEAGQAA
ncbi:MAG: metal-dependent hydrolase [Sphingopyxis sp.]|uniref:metal-dependent hydrolase n=1 Tax=Sphingopyxis sp. TaxID=1908224 RepID=UPI002ABB0EF7|nr:metal-dependent hydrolase [Sphingopyxis sp.]MDZ3830517.1 metal-dependent hydrolase [Sphingopyxis sp.]